MHAIRTAVKDTVTLDDPTVQECLHDLYQVFNSASPHAQDFQRCSDRLSVLLEDNPSLPICQFYRPRRGAQVLAVWVTLDWMASRGIKSGPVVDAVLSMFPIATDFPMPGSTITVGPDYKTPVIPPGLDPEDIYRQMLPVYEYLRSLKPAKRKGRPKGSTKPAGSGSPGISKESAIAALRLHWGAWAAQYAADIDLDDPKGKEKARSRWRSAREKGLRLV